MSYFCDDAITFDDELERMAEDFTHYTGLASCAIGDDENGQQALDAAAAVFNRIIRFARNVYEDGMDRAMRTPAAIILTMNDDTLLLGEDDPWNQRISGKGAA